MKALRLLDGLRERWRRRMAVRRRERLPEVLRLNLVAALEESRGGGKVRANHYELSLPAADYASAAFWPDLADRLARELAEEAGRRGYPLAGPVTVEIVKGEGPAIGIVATKRPWPPPEPAEKKELEATLTFRPAHRVQGPRPRKAGTLVVLAGPDRGSTFTLWGDIIYVGRSATNHVVLHDPGISRVHLELVRTADRWRIKDRGSLNGTWVNGECVAETLLEPGDQITLGSTCLEYRE
ncbi:MAG: hypothetical protein PWR31_879 [Bacillota bacterium]|nr:hypothetical protein [Bacillota bacterium]MDK2927189.1 hypothetical protein [Bacillota bacterium]